MSYLTAGSDHKTKLILFGALLPASVLVFELFTGMSGEIFADPVPDLARLGMVLLVPVTALLLLGREAKPGPFGRNLSFLTGAALGTAACYAFLYLPLLPFAVPGLIFLIGILPLTPLASLIALWLFTSAARKRSDIQEPWMLFGFASAFLLLLALDTPAALARLAIDRQQGGDSDGALVLAKGASRSAIMGLANDRQLKPTGVPSLLTNWLADGAIWETPRPARELLFLLSGEKPDSLAPASPGLFGRLKRRSWFDSDLGGEDVGNLVDGLSLASSRIDMEVLQEANAAYQEWTAEFANGSPMQQEARLTLALPEGAVASRATLWVNGEPREASVAPRSKARAAYQSVVSARRDPLLVTTDGSGRLLVQAFPVPAGQRLRLRIGVTAPLQVAADGNRSVGLPAIVRRNFVTGEDFRHDIRVEGASGSTGLLLSKRESQQKQQILSGGATDILLRSRTGRITAAPLPAASISIGQLGNTLVRQTIEPGTDIAPEPLILLVDASASNKVAAASLLKSLDAIGANYPVGLIVAATTVEQVKPAPWSPAQRVRFEQLLSHQGFRGGHDNIPALMLAMDRAGTILWVHGSQPIRFAHSTSELEAVLERARGDLPRLVRFQAVPGPSYGIPGNRWLDTARDVPPTIAHLQGLDALLDELTGGAPRWQVRRERLPSAGAAVPVHGGGQIVRLWAAGEASAARGKDRSIAATQAAALGLIASDTGAVVLESDAETQANGLPAPPSAIPAVPEPATWIMLISGFYLLGWQMRRQRSALARGSSTTPLTGAARK